MLFITFAGRVCDCVTLFQSEFLRTDTISDYVHVYESLNEENWVFNTHTIPKVTRAIHKVKVKCKTSNSLKIDKDYCYLDPSNS